MYPTGSANTAWKNWIFRESARRTFLICYFFLSLYHSLKGDGPYCHDHPEITSEWTASAYLWNAPSVFDFAAAWNERRHLVIRNLDHMPLLLDGDPSEVDSFGRIVIVTQVVLFPTGLSVETLTLRTSLELTMREVGFTLVGVASSSTACSVLKVVFRTRFAIGVRN